MTNEKDELMIGGHAFTSRFILGSGKYSYDLIDSAIHNAKAQIITMALRRNKTGKENILNYIPEGITILPNTSDRLTRKKQSEQLELPANSAAAILSSWKWFPTRNI